MSRFSFDRAILSVAAMLWMTVASAALATTYYVSKGGSNGGAGSQGDPWLTIQHAVDSVAGGDEIRIGEGTYSENVSIPTGKNDVTLMGGFETTGWTWDPTAHPTLVVAASPSGNVVTYFSQENRMVGLVLTGGAVGLYAEGDKNTANCQFEVAHCVITNNTSHGIYLPPNRGKNGVFASNCLIADNGGNGVYLNTPASLPTWLYNCVIANNSGDGFYFDNPSNNGADIQNTIITGNGGAGLRNDNTKQTTLGFTCLYANSGGNLVGSAWRVEANVLMADPVYAGSGDYHLQNGSPCIDYGTDLSGQNITNDLELTTRTAPYDMGCYQSANSTAARYALTFADATRADDSGAGTSWATAKKSIGAALAITASGGTCTVAPGTYSEALAMPPNVVLAGTNQSTTIVSGAGHHIVNVPGTGVALRKLTLTGGSSGVIITGGGTDNLLEDCTIRGNGYGIYAPSVGINRRFTVSRCTITNNSDTGIYMPANGGKGAVIARNCLIADNGGDGIFVQMNSTYASYVDNCTIANNTGSGWQDEATSHKTTYYRNAIITGNGEYGIRHKSGSVSYISYCDVYNNTAGDYSDPGSKLTILDGVLSVPPSFVGGGDYHLQDGSLCVEAGDDLSADSVTNDLEGTARDVPYDMGCYESSFLAAATYPDTFADSTRPDDTGEGTNWATAKQSIGAAVAVTDEGGTCHVAAGLYTEAVILPANFTLAGAGAATTVISNAATVVSLLSSNTTIRGFGITGGTIGIDEYGGGIDDVVIEACNIYGNAVGINSSEGDLYHRYLVSRCSITDNSGIGIRMDVSTVGRGAIDVRNSLIANNGGDGVFMRMNSTLTSSFTYCTLADNTGSGYHDYANAHRTTYFTNCIVTGNGVYGIAHDYTTYNNYVDYSCVYGNASGDLQGSAIVVGANAITDESPLLVPGGYTLAADSPCLNTAIDVGITNDLAGVSRPLRGGFDMGAYESNPAPRGTVILLH